MLSRPLCRAVRACRPYLRTLGQQRSIASTSKTLHAVPREPTAADLSHSEPFFDLSRQDARSRLSRQYRQVPTATPVRFLPPGTAPTDVDALKVDPSLSLSWDGTNLKITHADSDAAPTIVSQWWLRDHCPCTLCTNQITKQRQINLLKGQTIPRIRSVDFSAADMHIIWTDAHESTIPKSFILRHRNPGTRALRGGHAPLKLWGADLSPPTVPYASITPKTLGPTLLSLRQNGLVFIPDTPVTAEASESLLAQLGPIRSTHWGAFTVVTSDLTSKDTAWTSEALDPHNDNTYFSDAAGLQMLHLLSHEGTGGASLFVDGFAAAAQLYASDKAAYHTLASVGVHAHSSGDDGINVQPSEATPVLRHDPSGRLVQVRWNNADRAGLELALDEAEGWYAAASKFQALLDREENRFWIQLVPGTPVIFDNWRVLHGRAEFTGKRTMCGGYVNRDDYVSAYRGACYDGAETEGSTVTG